MFLFFSKKYYLRDLLEDFVDIHNHILPGIDDGSKNIQESLNLIWGLKKLGVKEFIPTPHIMQDFYPNTGETIGNAYQNLLENLSEGLLSPITINPAAEYMLDNHFDTLLETDNLFSLKENYILIELSYIQPPINLEDTIFRIKTKGYLPVLAHPERYSFYHNNIDYYKRLKHLGCYFQLNLLSLSNYYGKEVQRVADYLLQQQMIDFTGTDTHKMRHIEKLSNLTLNKIQKECLPRIITNTKDTFTVT